MNRTILIVEDEDNIRNLLRMHLLKENYNVLTASDGEEALEIFSSNNVHLILLDIMLPKQDGFSVLQRIRNVSRVPIILLTARVEDHDKVLGLGLGADDYVCKPFSIIEIVSRVKAHLRRYTEYATNQSNNIIRNGDLSLDLHSFELKKSDRIIDLLPKELKLLTLFMQNLDKVFTKQQLYESVWGVSYIGDANTIMVHISNLRDKIEDNPKKPRYLKTIRGLGYRLVKVDAKEN